MNLDSSEKNNQESKPNRASARASNIINAAMYTTLGASLAGVVGDVTKNEPPQKGPSEIARENIDHQSAAKEAGIIVFMLDGVFRKGGPHVMRDAEMLLLQYLEKGTTKEIGQAVIRHVSPEFERKQAIARLGEAILALSRFKGGDQKIDARVSDLLSRVALQFSEGMKALAGQPPNAMTPLTPGASSGDFGAAESDSFEGDSDGVNI